MNSEPTPTPQMPADPFEPGRAGAVQMHEFMMSLVAAGFTREEAFSIVRQLVIQGVSEYLFRQRGQA